MNPAVKRFIKYLSYATALGLFLVVLVVTVVPHTMRWWLSAVLSDNTQTTNIKDLNINWYSGRLELLDMRIEHDQQELLSLAQAEVTISWRAFFQGEIRLSNPRLEGLQLKLTQDDDSWRIAGWPFEQSKDKETEISVEKQSSWAFTIYPVDISNSSLTIQQPHGNTGISLNQLSIANVVIAAAKLESLSFFLDATLETKPAFLTSNNLQLAKPVQINLAGEYDTEAGITINGKTNPVGILNNESDFVVAQAEYLMLDDLNIHQQQLNLSQLQLGKLQVASHPTIANARPLLQSESLIISGISANLVQNQVSSKELLLDTAYIALLRDANQQWPALGQLQLLLNSGRDAKSPSKQPGWQFELGQFSLTKESKVYLIDQTISPAIEHDLWIESFNIDVISNADNHQSMITLQGKLNGVSPVKLNGRTDLLHGAQHSDASLQIESLDLPMYSPYVLNRLGYRVRTGQMNIAMQIQRDPQAIRGELNIDLNRIKLEPVDETTINQLTTQLQMPLPMALSFLRDSKEVVRLKVPIIGDPNSPDFALRKIIELAAKRALQKTATHYVEQTLYPYNLIYKAGKYIHKKATQLSLQPVTYAARAKVWDETMEEYLIKLTRLLEDKPSRVLIICGIPVSSEHADVNANATLANTRAQRLKSYFMDQGIAGERLLLCQIQKQDSEQDATPRVDLALE